MKSFIFAAALAAGLFSSATAFAEAKDSTSLFRQEGTASWYGAEFEGKPTASGEAFDSQQLTAAHPTLPFGTSLRITNTQNGKTTIVRVNDRGPFVATRIIDVSRAAAEKLDMIASGTASVVIESAAPSAEIAAEPTITLPDAAPQASKNPATIEQPPLKTNPQTAPSATAVSTQAVPAAPAAVPTDAAASTFSAITAAVVLPAPVDPAKKAKYRLQVGSYKTAKNASDAFDKLKRAGLSPAYEKNGDNYRVVIAEVEAADVDRLARTIGAAGFKQVLAREIPGSARP